MSFTKRNSPKVKVNGREWQEVQSLEGSTEKDRHYVVDKATGGISFGDGVQGKTPPSGATIVVRYRFGSGIAGNTGGKFPGIYRGIVVNNNDPQARLRLMVQVPDAGITSSWAASCMPVGATDFPQVGVGVWIVFEGGDISFPVWLGVASK